MTTPGSSPSKRRGRRPKISPELREAFCEGLRLGMKIKDSCELAGITETTYYRWMDEGERASEGSIRDFYVAVKDAHNSAKKRLFGIVMDEAEKGQEKVRQITNYDANGVVTSTQQVVERSPRDARLALMILERRYPEEFGTRRVMDHKGIPDPAPAAPPIVNLIFDDGEGDPDVIPFQYVDQAENLKRDGNGHGDADDLEAYEAAIAEGRDPDDVL